MNWRWIFQINGHFDSGVWFQNIRIDDNRILEAIPNHIRGRPDRLCYLAAGSTNTPCVVQTGVQHCCTCAHSCYWSWLSLLSKSTARSVEWIEACLQFPRCGKPDGPVLRLVSRLPQHRALQAMAYQQTQLLFHPISFLILNTRMRLYRWVERKPKRRVMSQMRIQPPRNRARNANPPQSRNRPTTNPPPTLPTRPMSRKQSQSQGSNGLRLPPPTRESRSLPSVQMIQLDQPHSRARAGLLIL